MLGPPKLPKFKDWSIVNKIIQRKLKKSHCTSHQIFHKYNIKIRSRRLICIRQNNFKNFNTGHFSKFSKNKNKKKLQFIVTYESL